MLTLLRKPKEAGHGEVFKRSQMDEIWQKWSQWEEEVIIWCHHLWTVSALSPLFSRISSASDPPLERLQLSMFKTQVPQFPHDFAKFTLWLFEPGNGGGKKKRQGARKGVEGEGVGWFEENNQASENFWKTASQPKRHNASLWRLNVHDCVCLLENLEGRGRGRRDTCDVWIQPDCEFSKK